MTSSIQKKDENDKRITRVFISEKGRKVQAQLVEFFNESKEVYFKDMTDGGDIETLNRLLTKITENVEQNIEENNNGNLLSKKKTAAMKAVNNFFEQRLKSLLIDMESRWIT